MARIDHIPPSRALIAFVAAFDELFARGRPIMIDGVAINHTKLNEAAGLAQIALGGQSLVMSKAIEDVTAERFGQVHREYWTPEHDDRHAEGELERAAACYALGFLPPAVLFPGLHRKDIWPWDGKWWKPKGVRRNLVRAAALLIAAIERIDRAEVRAAKPVADQDTSDVREIVAMVAAKAADNAQQTLTMSSALWRELAALAARAPGPTREFARGGPLSPGHYLIAEKI